MNRKYALIIRVFYSAVIIRNSPSVKSIENTNKWNFCLGEKEISIEYDGHLPMLT